MHDSPFSRNVHVSLSSHFLFSSCMFAHVESIYFDKRPFGDRHKPPSSFVHFHQADLVWGQCPGQGSWPSIWFTSSWSFELWQLQLTRRCFTEGAWWDLLLVAQDPKRLRCHVGQIAAPSCAVGTCWNQPALQGCNVAWKRHCEFAESAVRALTTTLPTICNLQSGFPWVFKWSLLGPGSEGPALWLDCRSSSSCGGIECSSSGLSGWALSHLSVCNL